MAATDIGIDLGTASIVVYLRGKGIVVKEPALVAYDKDKDRVMAVGEEARQMVGRTPGNIMAIRPLKEGVVSDYMIMEKMLRYFIQKAMGRRGFLKPRIVICLPTGVTTVERRAVEEATFQAGAREVTLVDEPMAAAIGAQIDVTRPNGNMVVDIGGGITDIAVISLGGIVSSASIKVAGDQFNEAIIRYVRKRYGLFIGEQTAEMAKIRIGTAGKRPRQETMDIKGRNVITGLPKMVRLTSEDVRIALQEPVRQILQSIHHVMERTLPEFAADITSRGIILAGGGAKLHGLEEVISESTGVPVILAEHPSSVVALGTGRYLETMAVLEKGF